MSKSRKTSNKKHTPIASHTERGFAGAAAVFFALLAVLAAGIYLGGLMPWQENPYNSYVLQAQSWLSGRLDLGRDFSWLEIAQYKGKYYISFPPFPSYIYLPFVLILGDAFRDGWFAAASFLCGGMLVYGIFRHFKIKSASAAVFAVTLTAGTNLLFVSVNSWVWFIAQNMCFTLTCGALLAALRDRRTLSLALLSCAVGCRPFQILYFPLLFYIFYLSEREKNGTITFSARLLIPLAAPIVIGGSYMILNYLRFDSPFEFGHNYLPEFTQAQHGQFSAVYLKENLYSLIRLPELTKAGIVFQKFNGFNMFIASPGLIPALLCCIRGLRTGRTRRLTAAALALSAAELFCIAMHKTMGGWHYGNRYTIDIIPFAVFIYAYTSAGTAKISKAAALSAAAGAALNLYWISIF